ncbi:MAG: hypothetical protein H8E12_16965 [Rhodobacteraceae bacterium]|nr:hypothetical protein [Paracoccaceae bacterium]
MIDKNKIIMEAFLDELSKTASVDKHALYGALARLGGSLVARLGGRGASMATRRGMV